MVNFPYPYDLHSESEAPGESDLRQETMQIYAYSGIYVQDDDVRDPLVWQTCIEITDALKHMSFFDGTLFQQLLKPVFYTVGVMMWHVRGSVCPPPTTGRGTHLRQRDEPAQWSIANSTSGDGGSVNGDIGTRRRHVSEEVLLELRE